jgi:hypothetical protein
MPTIDLPPRIDAEIHAKAISDLSKAPGDPLIVNWGGVRWVDLPEAISVLTWSARAARERPVIWTFSQPTDQIDELRFNAALDGGESVVATIERAIDRSLRQLRSRELHSNQLAERLAALATRVAEQTPIVSRWFEEARRPLDRAFPLGFLRRYNVLTRATEADVQIDAGTWQMPSVVFARAANTASLPLVYFAADSGVNREVERLSDPDALAKLFGNHAQMDVISGGALAQIVVKELGTNVVEHSKCQNAWLCTRLTGWGDSDENAYLEVTVADDGEGLATSVAPLIANDQRQVVKTLYESSNGLDKVAVLIAYAFDRFTSAKRGFRELVHLSSTDATLVSSGLFWIWSLVSSELGIIVVRSNGVEVTFDLSHGAKTRLRTIEQLRAAMSVREVVADGTMIRLLLPTRTSIRRITASAGIDKSDSAENTHYEYVWVGDLAKPHPPLQSVAPAAQASMPLAELAYWDLLLSRLRRVQETLEDADILLLDLCGIRPLWTKATALPLAHFFVEANYTSVFGRSAVVLWNVPESAAAVFSQAIRIAAERFEQLRDVRRLAVAIFDSGRMQFFAGAPAIEARFAQLAAEGTMPLSAFVAGAEDEDVGRLLRLIRENAHVVTADASSIRIRSWPEEVKSHAWNQTLKWFNKLLETSPPDGIHMRKTQGYFRLPVNGQYTRDFFHFRALLANEEARARVCWLLVQLIRAAQLRDGHEADWLVAVTRPAAAFASDVAALYRKIYKRSLEVVTANTTDELYRAQGTGKVEKPRAIWLCTVVSTGATAAQIADALPGVAEWIGTVTCVDTRDSIIEGATKVRFGLDQFSIVTAPLATGPVYTLGTRQIERLSSGTIEADHVTAIDSINMSPVTDQLPLTTAERDFWDYVEHTDAVLRFGHYEERLYHHYIYDVSPAKLLAAAPPHERETLSDFIAARATLDVTDPDTTIILHAPAETSYGETLARDLQSGTGALYRQTLYRDEFAGQLRFSPFAEHGVPWADATVIIVDDAVHTGETLTGLLDMAAGWAPRKIRAWIALTRLPVHKEHLFHALRSLSECTDVEVHFVLALGIPVYTARTCPLCGLSESLGAVEAATPMLKGVTQNLRRKLTPQSAGSQHGAGGEPLWRGPSAVACGRLREAIERSDFDERALRYLRNLVLLATEDFDVPAVMTLAAVVAAEPSLLRSSALAAVPQLGMIAAVEVAGEVDPEDVITLLAFAVHATLYLNYRVSWERVADLADAFCRNICARTDITGNLFGDAAALILALTKFDRRTTERQVQTRCALLWSRALKEGSSSRKSSPAEQALKDLYIRVAQGALVADVVEASGEDIAAFTASSGLFEQATSVASMFWAHDAENIKVLIDHVASAVDGGRSELLRAVMPLAGAVSDLQALQALLVGIDRKNPRRLLTGLAFNWNSSQARTAIGAVVEPVAGLFVLVSSEGVRSDERGPSDFVSLLTSRWTIVRDSMDPVFGTLFPAVYGVVDTAWQQFERLSGLPRTVAQPPTWNAPKSDRAFIPEAVLARFLGVTIQNLRTAAFADGADRGRARAMVEVSRTKDEWGNACIDITLRDNGLECCDQDRDHDAPRGGGHHSGLEDVATMAEWFEARLIGPIFDKVARRTTVTLRARKYK